MATITSAATGNFLTGGTWNGGVVPTTGDDAVASTGTVVTVDGTVTCDKLTNAGTGYFAASSAQTINANIVEAGTGSNGCVRVTHSSGTVTINGDVSITGTGGNRYGVSRTSNTSAIVINGSVTGGGGTNNHGFNSTVANASATINGDVTAGSGATACGAYHTGATQTLTVNGTITPSTTAPGVFFASSAGTLVHTGGSCVSNSTGQLPFACALTGTPLRYLPEAGAGIVHTYRRNDSGSPGDPMTLSESSGVPGLHSIESGIAS